MFGNDLFSDMFYGYPRAFNVESWGRDVKTLSRVDPVGAVLKELDMLFATYRSPEPLRSQMRAYFARRIADLCRR